jgi:hypothetical protein
MATPKSTETDELLEELQRVTDDHSRILARTTVLIQRLREELQKDVNRDH